MIAEEQSKLCRAIESPGRSLMLSAASLLNGCAVAGRENDPTQHYGDEDAGGGHPVHIGDTAISYAANYGGVSLE